MELLQILEAVRKHPASKEPSFGGPFAVRLFATHEMISTSATHALSSALVRCGSHAPNRILSGGVAFTDLEAERRAGRIRTAVAAR